MVRPGGLSDFVGLLKRVTGGKLEARIDGNPLVLLDGEHRSLTVQIGPLLTEGIKPSSVLRAGHLRLWQARGVPSALARSGWDLRLHDGAEELIRLGRNASALTGHVHVSPRTLGKLRRWL